MQRLLITGFDAFGEDSVNPTLDIIKELPSEIGDFIVCPLELPTKAEESVEILKRKIEQWKPDYVINLGLAKGTSKIRIEKVAINVDDFRIPDNAGKKYVDRRIEELGADGYFSNLPIKNLLRVMQENGYLVEISYSAGTFVCNHVMYAMQYIRHTKYPRMKVGFIHVPFYEEGNVGMSFSSMVNAIVCLIAHLHEEEIVSEAGTIW